MHFYRVVVLGGLWPGSAKGDLRGVNAIHQPEEALYGPAPHRTKLHRAAETLLCDYTVLRPDEVQHMLHHLGGVRERERKSDVRWISGKEKMLVIHVVEH